MSNPSQDLLFFYYDRSFWLNLGIHFPAKQTPASIFRSLDEYIQNELPEQSASRIRMHLEDYQTDVAPSVKTQPLLAFLAKNPALRPDSLLDFGCGRGHVTKYLVNRLQSVVTAWGIDDDRSALPDDSEARKNETRIVWNTGLESAGVTHQTCDLVIAVHSLHHLSGGEQGRMLGCLSDLLRPQGILYVYEDSWTAMEKLFVSKSPDLDEKFLQFSTQHKLQLFMLNEYWSNTWCYGRCLTTGTPGYRTLEEWAAVLASKCLEIVACGAIGFDVRRLHGVPSAWLIASRAK